MNRTSPIEKRYDTLGPRVVDALKKRHFEAYYCEDKESAKELIMSLIPTGDVVSWGGSFTMNELGVIEQVKKNGYSVIDRDSVSSEEERMELMRRGLTCDTFLMGSNAISEDGQLYNIDGNGNRVAPLIFGPKQVIVAAGMNKVAKTIELAEQRVRQNAAPLNAQRFDVTTPCKKAGSCYDCINKDSICVSMVRTRICRPAGRIKVILVGETLGL